MALVESLMKTETVTAHLGETVAHAAHIMTTNGVGALLVVDGERLVGILSERDVLMRVVGKGRSPEQTPVSDVATFDPVTVSADTHVRDCSALMRRNNIRHVPVVRDGRPVGILSARDLFDFVAASLEKVVDDAQYAEALAGGRDPYDHPGGSYGR